MSDHDHVPVHAAREPVSVSARLGRLQFHKSGKFRVLQLTDIQDGPKVSLDAIRLIEAACDAARPDLVVFTGDQIAGYDGAYSRTYRRRRWSTGWDDLQAVGQSLSDWVGRTLARAHEKSTTESPTSAPATPDVPGAAPALRDDESARDRDGERARNLDATRELVRHSIGQFLRPLIERSIPFAVTYGNHDFQCGLSNAEMDAIYREFPGCLNPESTAAQPGRLLRLPASGLEYQRAYACEPGTFALPVSDVDAVGTVLGLVILDSGDYSPKGGYGYPSARGMDFLSRVPGWLATRSALFQHIPLPQYYDLLKAVPPTTAYAIQGYRSHGSSCYVLDEGKTLPGSYLGEGVSCPDEDCGEYALLERTHGYFAVFTGHDHRNGFAGRVGDLLLAATPTCGFGSYGPVPERRAARLLEFDIRHPHHPRTQLLEFGTLVGKPTSHRAYTFAMSHIPASSGEAVNLLRKPGVLAGLLAAVAGVAASIGFTRRRR